MDITFYYLVDITALDENGLGRKLRHNKRVQFVNNVETTDSKLCSIWM